MKATVYFLFACGDGWTSRETTMDQAESDIRYWLGKSPGVHEMEDILVVPDGAKGNWLKVRDKMREEEEQYAQIMRDKKEREQYERLKAKFTKKSTPAKGERE